MSELDAGALGHKIGPLPAGAWVAAIAAGVGIAWYLRTHGSASSPATDSTTDGTGDFGDGLDNTMGTAGNLAGVDSNPTASLGPDGGYAAYADNDAWASAAWVRMYARGYAALATQQALRAYLEGDTLTSSQAALIDVALQLTGPPPIAPPVPDGGQTPAPTPPASGNPSGGPPVHRYATSPLGAVATGTLGQGGAAHGGFNLPPAAPVSGSGGHVPGPVHGTGA